MDVVTGRASTLQDRGHLDSTDSRFESFNTDMEYLSKHANTKRTVKINKFASRNPLWPKPDAPCNSEFGYAHV